MTISETKMQIVIDNYFKDECDVNTSIRQAFEKGFHIGVKKGASTNRPQGWIPCSEKLPSGKDYISDMVIWCTDKSIVGVGWYYERTKSWGTVDDTFLPVVGEVVAWMPLPEPMKGAEDE